MGGSGGGGQIAGTTIALIVRLVRRLAGEAGVAQMLALAGDRRCLAEVEDTTTWSTYDQATRLLDAGAAVTGNPDLGRMVGEETLLQYRGTEVAGLLRSLGSPGALLRNITETATKFSTATLLEAIDVSEESAVVVARAIDGLVRHQMMCDYTAGVLAQAPALFGMDPAVVVESTCQSRGAERCTYELRWNLSSSPEAEPARRIAYLEEQVATITDRFESLQATATELVAAEDVDQVLRAIVQRARSAVRTPQYVLAVRLGPVEPARVEHHGFEGGAPPDALVADLLADAPDDHHGSRLIVDVVTPRQWFGRLAALCPVGSRFLPGERRLLEAYAANAAVALEAAAALDEARRRQSTAQALLHLASTLARVANREDVAQRLADAIPAVVGGSRASVLLWDDEAQHLRFSGFAGHSETTVEALRATIITPSDTPELGAFLTERRPRFIDRSTTDPFLRGLLDLSDVASVAVVPVTAGDRLLGVAVAELPPGTEAGEDLLERLAGLTAHGATALENGRLLEQVRAQSLHDPLSGLPNRALLRDRVEHALVRGARTGTWPSLLFVDLDHFKQINDTLGHGIGDMVITVVADRLRQAVREADTVARIGGDEFAVLLEGLADRCDDACRLANLLLEVTREPLVVGGRTIRLSGSIGLAAATADDDHDSLLRRADGAMYDAKAAGRDRAALA